MTSFRRIALPGTAPEDVICLPDGRVVTGLDDGRLLSVEPSTGEISVLADTAGIHMSFWVGVACFAYLAFYALRSAAILRRQGIDLDRLAAEGGH